MVHVGSTPFISSSCNNSSTKPAGYEVSYVGYRATSDSSISGLFSSDVTKGACLGLLNNPQYGCAAFSSLASKHGYPVMYWMENQLLR
eukprot:15332028-Ditylum_brightwellii.AAC.1